MNLPSNEKGETIVYDKKYKAYKAKLIGSVGAGQTLFKLTGYDGKDEGYALWDSEKMGWSKKIKKLNKMM